MLISSRADFDRIEQHLYRGDTNALKKQIQAVIDQIESDGFADSFKGVFQTQQAPEERIDTLVDFLATQQESL